MCTPECGVPAQMHCAHWTVVSGWLGACHTHLEGCDLLIGQHSGPLGGLLCETHRGPAIAKIICPPAAESGTTTPPPQLAWCAWCYANITNIWTSIHLRAWARNLRENKEVGQHLPSKCLSSYWRNKTQGNQSWIFTGKIDADAPIFWPLDAKSQLLRKDPDAEKELRQK